MKYNLEFNACKPSVMTLESTYALTARNVPQDHLPITTRADLFSYGENGLNKDERRKQLTTLPLCKPTALTGPSCPRSERHSSNVFRSQTQITASLELGNENKHSAMLFKSKGETRLTN